jgi:hypothetical protein
MQAENMAHGFGVTDKTLKEMQDAGIDFLTGGNHVFKNPSNLEENFKHFPIIRPANTLSHTVGQGFAIIDAGAYRLAYINLIGQVYFADEAENPFHKLDALLLEIKAAHVHGVIVEFHAEATSEKKCLGHYGDGRVSLLYGTHTHVQTSDDEITADGTGYITDIGMCGLKDSSLGMDYENIIKNFLAGTNEPKVIPDHGHCIVNGIFAKIDVETAKTVHLERIRETVDV